MSTGTQKGRPSAWPPSCAPKGFGKTTWGSSRRRIRMPLLTVQPLQERAFAALRQAGNPFRNYFARNPDDEVCSRYHVPELYAREREQLLAVVDLYRVQPATHSEVVPVLGNKGSGKTHLLHSIKHGPEGTWQLLVTPGT